MRHVRHELRLHLRSQRQLLRSVLEREPGLLDLRGLQLDVAVLPGQQCCLVLELGVRGLQFLLPGSQLAGQALRLVQQRVGPRVRGDGVHRYPDDLLQLLEEVTVHRRELVD